MKFALLGTRGVPASYSGFETAVEAVGTRLAARGHDVTVYCRPHAVAAHYRSYRGMRLVHLPAIATKHLDTFVHTLLSTLHMAFAVRPDVALSFIVGNAPTAALSRMLGIPTILSVDGLDSERAKWSGPAKSYLRWAQRNARRCADRLVTDSEVLQRIYRERYGAVTEFIPYGADMTGPDSGRYLARFGLRRQGYILFVGRLVPENNAHVLLEAFTALETDLQLVVVGDAPYEARYQDGLRAALGSDPRVVFTGYLFDEGYRELARNAEIFVVPSEVGGSHPVLLEGICAGNCVVVNDHEPNLEVLGDAGLSYPGAEGAAGLRRTLQGLIDHPQRIVELRAAALERARSLHSWDVVTAAYERLARTVIDEHRPRA
jgi:glycosyltransferase involved in cell wall biosynthesis